MYLNLKDSDLRWMILQRSFLSAKKQYTRFLIKKRQCSCAWSITALIKSIMKKNKVLIDDKLSTLDKITAVLSSLPDSYRSIDFDKLYVLKKDYPLIYERVENRLESGWENTIALLKQGINEGVVKPVNLQIFKTMFEVTLEQFFKRDVLVKNNISYNEALDSVVDIMINGIANK